MSNDAREQGRVEEPKVGELYYHYKHPADSGVLSDHAYVVIGIGLDASTDVLAVFYRPLYEFKKGDRRIDWCSRSLEDWMTLVMHEGNRVPRFRRITESGIVTVLRVQEMKLYGTSTKVC